MLEMILIEIAQLLLAGLGAPLVVGFIRVVKACLQGRRGARLFQPYFDLWKLLRKEAVISEHASWVLRLTPYIQVATLLVTAIVAPLLYTRPALGFTGDIIVLMYLFLLGTFFLALAGLDTGSTFGGMGSSREMLIAALAEPTIMVAIFGIALRAGTTNLGGIVERFTADQLLILNPGHLLAFSAFFIVTLAETGRLPVDNPATHLELTMIHEAMVLEYSGRHLALIEWAASLKLFIFLALLSNLFMPWGVAVSSSPAAIGIAAVALLLKIGLLGTAIAIIETLVAKIRLFRVVELLSGSFVLALLSIVSFFVLR